MRRNKFSLSHYKLFTCDMGYLIPTTWFEALPGDTIQMSTSALIRVSPLLAPIMHPVRVRLHNWFVPIRLIWDTFEDFITGGADGLDNTTPPYFNFNGDHSGNESGLGDYLGYPPIDYTGKNFHISALPARAYALIFNEFYRDQDLTSEVSIDTTDGSDVTTPSQTLNSVAWEKDYFTTARDSESKGATVSIPLTGDAPVYGIGKGTQNWTSGPQAVYETAGADSYANFEQINPGDADALFYVEKGGDSGNDPNIYADTSSISGVDINDLRLAFAIQKYQEARQKFGSRYVEYLRYLGVRSSDSRLQKPEYLGGGRSTVQFSEVLEHSSTGTLGDMAGHGIGAMRTKRVRRFFEEHGIVMQLMSVVPKTIYSQGLHRGFAREVKEDYWQKELQIIGDQEVLNQEVYVDAADPDGTFGYQARYDEYRSLPSSIAGEFRSSLDHWHMARIFASEPALNSSFVTCVPTKRMLASSSTDALYCMASHSIQARRPLIRRR